MDHIAWDLDIDGPAVLELGREGAIHFTFRSERIVE